MDASCGPSNAVSQLAKHSQRDQTLQRERFSGVENAAFRSQPAIDGNLNRDFHQFNETEMGHQFQGQRLEMPHNLQNQHHHNQNLFQAQFQRQAQGQSQGLFQNQHQGLFQNLFQNQGLLQNQGQKGDWVQDFGGMSLQNQKSDWQLQFMQTQNRPMYGMGQGINQPRMGQMRMNQMSQNQMGRMNQTHEIDELLLEAQFDQIEREMDLVDTEKVEEKEADAILQDYTLGRSDNEQFAEAARQVQHSMLNGATSEETSQKFQQSDFLKLMTLISDRQVELSLEGDKLVTREGQDIRQHLSDPLKDEKLSYHDPVHEDVARDAPRDTARDYPPLHGDRDFFRAQPSETVPESESVRSHLPDPLAHIKDGQLSGDLSSLQAAQVVSGGQVQANGWMEDEMWEKPARRGNSILSRADQEIFDDYRHDDDNF